MKNNITIYFYTKIWITSEGLKNLVLQDPPPRKYATDKWSIVAFI